jgi:hypothetical protein
LLPEYYEEKVSSASHTKYEILFDVAEGVIAACKLIMIVRIDLHSIQTLKILFKLQINMIEIFPLGKIIQIEIKLL